MLNPIYTSLNQILKGMGEQGSFTQVSNQKVEFLPNGFNDTKLSMVLPLVNTEIYYNRRIKKEMISYAQDETNVYKRGLVKEIKTAYLKYLQSVKAIEAYISAKALVIRYAIVNGGAGRGGFMGGNSNSDITNWIKENGKVVDNSEWQDSTTSNNQTGNQRLGGGNGKNSVQLYDLK